MLTRFRHAAVAAIALAAIAVLASLHPAKAIDAGSSSNYDTTNAAASGYVLPIGPGTGHNGTTQTSTTTSFGAGFTQYDRDFAVTNGATVYSVGIYSTTAGSMTAKIALENSTTSFSTVVNQAFSHPGTGWYDVVLSSPYVVPGSGTYRVGFFVTGTQVFSASGNRSLIAADVSGTNAGFSANAAGNLSTGWTEATSAANMTLVTTAQTADASASKVRVLLEYNPVDAVTLNTDLTVEVTCDNGSNWASATLSAAGTGQAGHSIAETEETTCTAGTQIAARVKTLNNKNVQLHGTAVNWR